MTDYLAAYQKIGRIKIDADLASRWAWDASYHGDKNIKIQMATARRTATVLQKSIDLFTHMRPEQELAIKAAASAMRSLASDMEKLSIWAKGYHLYCEAARKKERAAALEAIAAQRWGNDTTAMLFEKSVIEDLGRRGNTAFATWMKSRSDIDVKHIATLKPTDIYHPFFSTSWAPGRDPRAEMAEKIEEAMGRKTRDYDRNGDSLFCSFVDYEAYLIWRKAMAATTSRIVQMAVGAP